MKNLIPYFIYDKYLKYINKGRFNAVTMFVDISGFTPMTERLLKEGWEGAEVLSDILNNIFDPLITAVYERGGFISDFAGDAFTAVFTNTDIPYAGCFAALDIKETFKKKGLQKTKFGNFNLTMKIGLSYGDIKWGIVGSEQQKTYFFKGTPVKGCVVAEKHCNNMEILIDLDLKSFLSKKPISDNSKRQKFFKLIKMSSTQKDILIPIEEYELKKYIVSKFVSDKVIDYTQRGEFRYIVSLFVAFKDYESFSDLNNFIANVISKISNFGGYFNHLDFADKGNNFLIFFGAPTSFEDNIQRAINFILSLKKEYQDRIKAGITFGMAYAGYIGSEKRSTYTCLGDVVNLSSRLMSTASFGEIWLTDDIKEEIKESYETRKLGLKSFKGKSKALEIFELIGRKRYVSSRLFEGEMIGREREAKLLLSYCKTILDGQFGSVCYIYGEPGIGKSRLAYEVSNILKDKVNNFTLQVDGILKNSMNPFTYFFNRYFRQLEVLTSQSKKAVFDEIYDKLINDLRKLPDRAKTKPIIRELLRTKSIIASLVGIRWKNSLYEQLDAKGKYENTIFAIKDFFRAQSLLKPVILVLEDLQWLDVDSQKIFNVISRNMDDFPLIIVATSRFKDDGSKPELMLDDKIIVNHIDIKQLNNQGIEDLIKDQLEGKSDPKLLSYITLKSEGNPFYIEQFCKFLKENGIIEKKDGELKLLRTNIEIPKDISAVLIARVDRLSPVLKELVQLATILGREFDIEVLEELINVISYSSEYENTSLKNKDINTLLIKGEQERIWTSLTKTKYVFNHKLLQESVYFMQLKSRLKRLHRIAGECIEKLYKDNKNYYSDIAFHYENASILDKTTEYLEKAGDFAKESYQNEQALQIYQRLLKYVNEEREEIEIHIKEGEIYQFTGDWNKAENIYKHNINRARELKDSKLIAEIEYSLGKLYQKKGKYDEALNLLENALKLYNEVDEKKGICSTLGSIGVVYHRRTNYDKAMSYYEQQLQIAKELNDEKSQSEAIGHMGIVYKNKANYDKAMEYYDRQLKIAEKLNDKLSISTAYANMGTIHRHKENLDKAIECWHKQLNIGTELGNKLHISNASGNIGVVYFEQGNYEKAIIYYNKQKTISAELGNKLGTSLADNNIGQVYFQKGQYKKAVNHYQRSYKIFKELNYKQGIIVITKNIGDVHKKLENYEKAEEYYNNSIKLSRELEITFLLSQSLYDLAHLYFIQYKRRMAKIFNEEALKTAEESENKEITFKAKILEAKITATNNTVYGLKQLVNLLKEIKKDPASYNEEQKAELNYELFMLSGDKKYKTHSLELYEKMYDKEPSVRFKEKINEMAS